MNDQELDRRLSAIDPARSASSLDSVVDRIVGAPAVARRSRGWRVATITGGAILVFGAVAAFTDLDEYMLSIPPFSTLDEGTVRTTDGLPYVPLAGGDRGEQCAMWLDFGGLAPGQFAVVNDYWSHADAAAFAAGVVVRFESAPPAERSEELAQQRQLLDDLGGVIPGIEWGSAAPGSPWPPGDPHLTSFSTLCTPDVEPTR